MKPQSDEIRNYLWDVFTILALGALAWMSCIAFCQG